MLEKLILAGFGGQGILTVGKLLAECAVEEGLEVTYLPSYGSEVRGGTANCSVVISDSPICSPVVERADSLFIMNEESFQAFAPLLKPGGLLLVNSSLINLDEVRRVQGRPRLLAIDATNLAASLGNIVVANVIMTGAYLAATSVLPLERCSDVIERSLGQTKAALIEINKKALSLGAAEAGRAPASNAAR